MDACDTVERVLTAVEQIPAGRVVSYSDLAGLIGTSARRVGRIMTLHGASVPWWRVTNAAGRFPEALLQRAHPQWMAEGIPLAQSGRGCRIGECRADLEALADAYAAATGPVAGVGPAVEVLVVDAANVVGSVPDGWWRDRAGAASRLHDALVAAPGDFGRVILVLEGRARTGVPVGSRGVVETVHAPGSGDDEIVKQCTECAGSATTVATADRGLIERVEPLGARVIGARGIRDGVPLPGSEP